MAGNPFDQFDQPQGFTPVPGVGPNPKLAPEVQSLNLGNQKTGLETRQLGATLPSTISKAQSDAVDAAAKAAVARQLAGATLAKTQAEAAQAQSEGQAKGDQHKLMQDALQIQGQIDKNVVIQNLNRAMQDAQRPLATGALGSMLQYAPAVGDWATNANYLAHDLNTIRTNNALLNILNQRAQSPTGSTGMRVTQQEFKAFQDALGNLDLNQSRGRLIQNLQTMQGIWRNHLMRQAGVNVPPYSPPKSGPVSAPKPQSNIVDWADLP